MEQSKIDRTARLDISLLVEQSVFRGKTAFLFAVCIVKIAIIDRGFLSPKLSLFRRKDRSFLSFFFFFFRWNSRNRAEILLSFPHFSTLFHFVIAVPRPSTRSFVSRRDVDIEAAKHMALEPAKPPQRYVVERETVSFRVVVKRRRTGGNASAIAFNGHREHRAVVPANWCTDNSLRRRIKTENFIPLNPPGNRSDLALKNVSLIKSKM